MHIRIAAVATVLALVSATALAGCGSGGGTKTSQPASTNSAGTMSSANSSGTGAPSTTSPTSSAAAGGGGPYCDTIKADVAMLAGLQSLNPQSLLGTNLGTIVTAVSQIDGQAPADIKPAWDLVSSRLSAFVAALGQAGITSTTNPATLTAAQLQAIQAAAAPLGAADVKAAMTQIQSDVQTRCGLGSG